MANKTIYPFGVGGQLPSGIAVVNDLTTGGANNALSAEMGKTLNGKIGVLTQFANTAPLSLSSGDFEYGTLANNAGTESLDDKSLRSRFINIVIGVSLGYTVETGYSLKVFEYDSTRQFVRNSAWLSSTGTYSTHSSTEYIRLVLYKTGITIEDANGNFAITPAYIFKFIPECVAQGEKYAAISRKENTTPLTLTGSDFRQGNIGNTGKDSASNSTISCGFIRIYPGATISFSASSPYTVKICEYTEERTYIKASSYAASGSYKTGRNTFYIRITIYSGSSQVLPIWNDVNLSVTPDYLPVYARAVPEEKINDMVVEGVSSWLDLELPILAPSPQLPADGTGDINANTMTSMQIQDAIEDVIAEIPSPGGGYYITKYGTIYDIVGRDASNQYDIKAYVFTKRNRLCYRAAAALYAWANGGTTYYTDHRSPLVGDAVYSDTARTSSGYTVTAYDCVTEAITVNGVAYTRNDSGKVAPDEVFVRDYKNSGGSVTVYDASGNSLGTATVSSNTLTFSGKTYTRYSSRDFHTDNKATIILWGNEHGPASDPNEPSIILYRLVKDLVNGCVGNPFLQFLHNYCKVVIIPAANPYGVNIYALSGGNGRNNANNVNINRNYDTHGWAVVADADKGSYAGDQPETQFIMNTVLDIGADIAIDIHCLGNTDGTENGFIHYDGDVADSNSKLVQFFINYCGLYYTSYGTAKPETAACGDEWIYTIGIAGGLIEMNPGMRYNFHTGHIMWSDYTLLLNTIRMWYSKFDPTLDLRKLGIK